MAVGQVAGGMPAFGVWFSCGAFAASLYWMLLGWTLPRWALATTLAVILINMASYWSQSYWGGWRPPVAALSVRRAASNFRADRKGFRAC